MLESLKQKFNDSMQKFNDSMQMARAMFAVAKMHKKGQSGLIGLTTALIIGVIGLTIVNEVINGTAFTGLTDTVTSYITVGFAVLLLVLAFTGGRSS